MVFPFLFPQALHAALQRLDMMECVLVHVEELLVGRLIMWCECVGVCVYMSQRLCFTLGHITAVSGPGSCMGGSRNPPFMERDLISSFSAASSLACSSISC